MFSLLHFSVRFALRYVNGLVGTVIGQNFVWVTYMVEVGINIYITGDHLLTLEIWNESFAKIEK